MKKMIMGMFLLAVLFLNSACKPQEIKQFSNVVSAIGTPFWHFIFSMVPQILEAEAKDTATEVAEAFFEALDGRDIKTAKLYATEETAEML